MSKESRVSRRSSLKGLGALGATTLLGGVAAETAAAESEAPKKEAGKPAAGPVELAVARFGKGHSCAQAVFSAFAEQIGMDYQTAVKLTAGFGGGMGMGGVCGVVTGAYMAIGLKFGGVEPKAKEQTAKLAREFAERFKARHRSLVCRDLLGCDVSTPEGRKISKEKNLHDTVCTEIVRDAAKILSEILTQPKRS
jgi:C_GCAxxG_C_C family probable redox protein